jgi:hypothetical protein
LDLDGCAAGFKLSSGRVWPFHKGKLIDPSGDDMTDEVLARIRTHRNNIARYCRILKTELTELERSFIERRMAEEGAALEALAPQSFPPTLGVIRSEFGSPSAAA